ncbi:MAG: YgjV family protein [Clostridia bacterium]|nr:YgjV family protein [Clostridia bacterium]
MNIFAQIVGIIAIFVFAIIPHQKTKNKILILQLISSLLYAIQYFLLGAFSAVVTNIIDIIKTIIFSKYARKNKKIPMNYLIIYIVIIIVSGIFTINSFFSVFPIVGAILFAYAAWQDNLKIFRIMNIFGILIYTVYNFYVGAYVSFFGNIVQLISSVVAVIRLDIKKCCEMDNHLA